MKSHRHKKDVPGVCTTGFCIVGIGASAGGLEAFTELLQHLPLDTGLGFVLVQHLDPQHESALTQLLTRVTSMPVREVTHNLRVQANHVFVIPPNTCMFIERGILKLQSRDKTPGAHHSIDFFFESLAQDQRERVIGVILSGTATDGTLGLEAIKAEGGITFAQDDSAQHDSMPRSAVAAGCVDFVLSPANIAKELAQIAKHPYVAGKATNALIPETAGRAAPSAPRGAEDGYKKILLLLRNHSGVDFSLYKSTTIQRRTTRRMVLNQQDSLEDYANFLRGNSKELDALYSDALIGVTSFFRNPEAFDVLKRKVFPKLLHQRGDEPFRVWVLGCSTGQEAYSIAMAFTESAEKSPRARKLQVFATDLNDAVLEKARHGLYAKSLAEEVSPERLRRFFVQEEGGYRVIKPLREMVVFARQNLIGDPPFSRIDLISCRNLLIYLERSLQQKIMPTFHYALKPGGFLFLGASESIGGFTELFEPVDRKQKIYSRKAAPTPAFHLPVIKERGERPPAVLPMKAEVPESLRGELSAQREADRVTVNQFAPPSVLINAGLQILQFRGPTGAYLEPPTGKASFDVLKMAREGLMLPLRAAINKAKKENKTVRKENVPVRESGKTRAVNVEVIPLKNLRERCFLILFEDAGVGRAVPSAPPKKEAPRRVTELERELSETRDFLQSIQEQHEAANEELQASNEEVQSANEELQSLNEELETSKEELESSNEELTTVNEELANSNVELERSNRAAAAARDYAEAIIRTVPEPLLVLDAGLCVVTANEAFYDTFKVSRSESMGRLVYDLGNRQWNIPKLRELLEHILPDKSVFNDFEVTHEFESIGPRTMLLNARKLDSIEGQPARILLGLHNITDSKQAEEALRESEEGYRTLFHLSPMAVYTIDSAGVIQNFNRHAAELWGREPAVGDTDQRFCGSFKMFRPEGSFMPREQCSMAEVVSGKLAEVRDGEVHIERPDGSRVVVLVNIRPLKNERGEVTGAINCFYDITARKRMEDELAAWQRELESRVAELKTQVHAEADERKRLEAEVAGAVELEQERLGQELHDGLAQELTGISMMLDTLAMKLKKESPPAANEVQRLRLMLETARNNARSLAKVFYPVELERHGLLVALQELAKRNQEKFGVPCKVKAEEGAAAKLKDIRAIQLYRIAQEAVHNAAKHAKAKNIRIRLTTQNGNLLFTVKDDGVGLPKKTREGGGMGLRIMQYRARMIGGTLEVRNDNGGGVIVSCVAPC